MVKIGSKNNLIKNMMSVLGNKIDEARISEAMTLLNEICKYEFKPDVPVFFYYDKYIDDMLYLTENKKDVDWDASLIVEIVLSNKVNEGFGIMIWNE